MTRLSGGSPEGPSRWPIVVCLGSSDTLSLGRGTYQIYNPRRVCLRLVQIHWSPQLESYETRTGFYSHSTMDSVDPAQRGHTSL